MVTVMFCHNEYRRKWYPSPVIDSIPAEARTLINHITVGLHDIPLHGASQL